MATNIYGLAIDPTNGQFFGSSVSSLYRIDPTTGVVQLIGDLGTTTRPFRLEFDRAGQLFGVHGGVFYSIDKATAALTSIGNIPFSFSFGGLAVRPEDGVIFGIGLDREYQLFTIDSSDASIAVIGASLSRPEGLAFLAIPEPSATVLFLLAIFLSTGLKLKLK